MQDLKCLEDLIVMLKSHNIISFKNEGLEIVFGKPTPINENVLEEEKKPEPQKSIFDDPDFFAHLPQFTKTRHE